MATQPLDELKQLALQAFERDLPQLWAQRPSQWVAYRGDQQLGFAPQKHVVYQQCFQRGLQQDDFVVFCIEAQDSEMTLSPVALAGSLLSAVTPSGFSF
jgi:hypothetical protein